VKTKGLCRIWGKYANRQTIHCWNCFIRLFFWGKDIWIGIITHSRRKFPGFFDMEFLRQPDKSRISAYPFGIFVVELRHAFFCTAAGIPPNTVRLHSRSQPND